MKPGALAALLGLLAGAAAAQPVQSVQSVHRCEGADGKVTYANTACPSGTTEVRKVEAAPPPAGEDARAARERARKDAQQVGEIERQRRAEDDKIARERAAAQKKREARETECRRLAARLETAQVQLDRASANQRESAQRSVQKAREQFDARCK